MTNGGNERPGRNGSTRTGGPATVPPPTTNGRGASNESSGRDMGWRRRERIRLAVLAGTQRRRQATESSDHPSGSPQTGADSLTFKQPPGLLPPTVRRRLQGDVMPQVTPAMMRQLAWPAGFFKTSSRLFVYGFAALRWSAEILWDKLKRVDSLE